jgi:hypothetical protein
MAPDNSRTRGDGRCPGCGAEMRAWGAVDFAQQPRRVAIQSLPAAVALDALISEAVIVTGWSCTRCRCIEIDARMPGQMANVQLDISFGPR